jgi:hypothetical protein
MKKRMSALAILVVVLLVSFLVVNAATESIIALIATFDIYVNGEKYQGENPPIVIEGRTYLPLRAIGEVLGIDVEWNQQLRRVEVERPSGGEIVEEVEEISGAPAGYGILPEIREVKFSKHDPIDLKVGSLTATKGSTVEIPVYLGYVPKGGIFETDFELLYDRDILEIESVKPGKLLSGDGAGFSYIGGNGIVNIKFDSNAGRRPSITSDGELAVITAKIKNNAPTGKTAIRLSSGGYFEDNHSAALWVWYIPGIITVE